MSIGGTLSSALSGLTASAKAAELVSSNIANATTPGYARREIQLAARTVGTQGQGVLVIGVRRAVDIPLLGDRRLSQSTAGDADTRATFLRRLEQTIGTPDQAFSLNGRVAALEAALTEASSHPESEPRLSAVLSSAKGLATQIGIASKDVQAARTLANSEIKNNVGQLNSALERVVKLNTEVRRGTGLGQDVAAFQDQRQQVIDQIARIIPLREIQQTDGSISLFTPSGAVLLDGVASVFGFNGTSSVNPYVANGIGLSGLTLNGNAIPTKGEKSVILGGSLGANFAVRDELAVSAQSQLDALARDLVERFSDSGLDPSLAPGDPGLFTDAGASFDTLNEVGLSQRIKVNTVVDPAGGGAVWRLRSGFGATAPGPAGDTTLLTALRSALTTAREPVSGGFMAGQRSFATLSSDLLSSAATARVSADGEAAYARTRLETFESIEAENGVDTDQEMQTLLQIEQAYAANAKVIQMVGQMIERLLEI